MSKTSEARKMLGLLTEEMDRMDVLHAINERQRDTIRLQRDTIARLNRDAERMQREAFERGRSDRVNPFRFDAGKPSPELTARDPINLGTIRMTTATTAPDFTVSVEAAPEWHGIPIEDPSDHVDPSTMDSINPDKPKVLTEVEVLRDRVASLKEQIDIGEDEWRRVTQHLRAIGVTLKYRDDGSFVGVEYDKLGSGA